MMEPYQIATLARLQGVKRYGEGMIPAFKQRKAYYRDTGDATVLVANCEISVGYVKPGHDYLNGDLTFQFGTFRSDGDPWMRMLVFSDGMATLANMPELVVAMGVIDNREERTRAILPEELTEILLRLGYTDLKDRPE